MKVAWESDDIVPGRRYGKSLTQEQWIIGYLPGIDSDERYVSISLSDGMVTKRATKARMAESMTENGYIPAELLSE